MACIDNDLNNEQSKMMVTFADYDSTNIDDTYLLSSTGKEICNIVIDAISRKCTDKYMFNDRLGEAIRQTYSLNVLIDYYLKKRKQNQF